MSLTHGQTAPDFTVQDIDGNTIRLSDYNGKKLLLCFFRYAACPFCNLILHSFIERYPKLHENGLEVLAFVQSSRESILDYPLKRQLPRPPFPLIPDPEQKVYKLYEVDASVGKFMRGVIKVPLLITKLYKHHFPQGKIDGNLLLMPAFFLIGPHDLTVYEAYYSPDFATMIPDVDIVNFISET
jgi:peroxiredoxin Q/BCP